MSEWRKAKTLCDGCNGDNVYYELIIALGGAREDYHFHCSDCDYEWWSGNMYC